MTRPTDPLVGCRFAVEVDGLIVGGFTEVSGLESRIEVTARPEGGVNGHTHQVLGATQHENLVLRRGLAVTSTLWDWYERATRGEVVRRNGAVIVYGPARRPAVTWHFRSAVPVRWSGPSLEASSDQVAVETVELVHEGLTRAAGASGG